MTLFTYIVRFLMGEKDPRLAVEGGRSLHAHHLLVLQRTSQLRIRHAHQFDYRTHRRQDLLWRHALAV